MGFLSIISGAVRRVAEAVSTLVQRMGEALRDVAQGFDRDRTVSSTEQPCPLQKSIRGRFGSDEAKCGDRVELQADANLVTEGSEVSFALHSLPGRGAIETLTASLSGSSVRGLQWTSKKPTNDWPRPEIGFVVSAEDVSSDSENFLNIHRYPNQPSETKTTACSSGIYGWTGKFDIQFQDGVVMITVKIKLTNRLGTKPAAGDPMPAAGDPVSDADKETMRTDIEGKLTEKWLLHRDNCQRGEGCDCPGDRKCCKFKVQIRVRFVESGEHHVVNLFQGSGRANASNWTRVKTRDNSWAHETGHLLSWYDEYTGGAVGTAPRWQAPRAGAIMHTGLTVPSEYYWDFRDGRASKTNEPWEFVAP